jgi:alpha-mannosidase
LEGPVATTVVTSQSLPGGGSVERTIRLYRDHPRIDLETTLTDVPDGVLVSADFPLAGPVQGTPRGVPYGFAENSQSEAVIPAVRWSAYDLTGGSLALLDVGVPGRELTGDTASVALLNAHEAYRGKPNPWLSGAGRQTFRTAILASAGSWRDMAVPRRAWEMNSPPLILAGTPGIPPGRSWLTTSDNVIVESVRRVGGDLEIRAVDWTGRGGAGYVEVHLPHGAAVRADALGENHQPLAGGPRYELTLTPQQIVTLRLALGGPPIPASPPLTPFRALVPPAKLPSLEIRHQKAGHPPE